MKNPSTDDDGGIKKQVPQGPWQAVFQVVWPLNNWWKKVAFIFAIIFVAFFAIWVSLPEITKTETIDYLKGSKKAQPPAIDSNGKESSEFKHKINPNLPKETTSPVVPQAHEEQNTLGPPQEGIQQQTEGDQSPAVVSGGNVNISIKGKHK